LPSEVHTLRLLSPHLAQAHLKAQDLGETSRFCVRDSATCTTSKSWSYHAGILYYALVNSRKAQQRDRFNSEFKDAYCAEACSKHFQ